MKKSFMAISKVSPRIMQEESFMGVYYICF